MTFNRSLFYTIVTLLFSVLFIPLIAPYAEGSALHNFPLLDSSGFFFPFITGKNFAFRIIVELATLAWVVLMLRDKSYRPKFSLLSAAIAVFVGVVFVADIFAVNPVKAFIGNFERMEGWISLVHLLAFYLVVSSVFKTWDFWKRFFQVSVGVSALVCLYGFAQLSGSAGIHQSTSRLDASFGNATYLAIYMLFHVFISIILLLKHRKEVESKKTKNIVPFYQDFVVYTYLVAILAQTAVLFFTATRGSILGLIGGLIVSAGIIAFTEKENKVLRKISIGVLVALMAIVCLFVLTKNTDFVKKNEVLGRIASISATDNTTKSRFMIWDMAWKGVFQNQQHFILGWGQEGFNYIFNQYYNPGMYGQEQWFDRSHNVVFDWLTQAGVLGLLSYLSIFGFVLYTIWQKSNLSNTEKALLIGLLAGYFFHNLFVFDNITSYIMFFIILAYVNVSATPLAVPTKNEKQDIGEYVQYGVIVLAVIAFIGVFYQYNYKAISANLSLMNALTKTAGSETVASFKEAISYNTTGLYETREQLLSSAQSAYNSKTLDAAVKIELIDLAKSEIKKQLVETPGDARYYVLGGSFFQGINEKQTALEYMIKASALSPQKQTIMFSLGSVYFANGKANEALATFQKAYELDKSFDEAKKFYGLAALYVGKDNVTNDLLGPGPVMDERFLSAYVTMKKYDLMIAYLLKGVESKPNDIQARVSLAVGYMTAGDVAKTISTLKLAKTLTIDTGAQSQIDGLIKDIQAGKNPFVQKS